jgi:plastocyanin
MHPNRLTAGLGLVFAFMVLPPLCIAADIVNVSIRDYRFDPPTVQVKPGATVRWTNHEKRANHSIYFGTNGSQESERLFPGDSWQRTFDRPGTYSYACGPHPEMVGRIIVSEIAE